MRIFRIKTINESNQRETHQLPAHEIIIILYTYISRKALQM
jgi:hypothetical protein